MACQYLINKSEFRFSQKMALNYKSKKSLMLKNKQELNPSARQIWIGQLRFIKSSIISMKLLMLGNLFISSIEHLKTNLIAFFKYGIKTFLKMGVLQEVQ
jgi:hypothetical protein